MSGLADRFSKVADVPLAPDDGLSVCDATSPNINAIVTA